MESGSYDALVHFSNRLIRHFGFPTPCLTIIFSIWNGFHDYLKMAKFWLFGDFFRLGLLDPPKTRFWVEFEYSYSKCDSRVALVPFQIGNYGTSAFQRRVWRLFWASRTIFMPIWKLQNFRFFGHFGWIYPQLGPKPKTTPFEAVFFIFSMFEAVLTDVSDFCAPKIFFSSRTWLVLHM